MGWLDEKIDELDNPGAPVATSRALNASFKPSVTKFTLAMYTIQFACTDGQVASVELRSDAVDPPTTVRASARLDVAGTAAVQTSRQQLTYIVPKDHFVSLVSAGTGTPTIAHQTETVIS